MERPRLRSFASYGGFRASETVEARSAKAEAKSGDRRPRISRSLSLGKARGLHTGYRLMNPSPSPIMTLDSHFFDDLTEMV